MDYQWPTEPSLRVIFGSSDRKDWWPLEEPLSGHNHAVFQPQSPSLRRQELSPHPNDDFMNAMQQSRLKPRPAGGFGLTKPPSRRGKKKLQPITQRQEAPDPAEPDVDFDLTIPLDASFGGGGLLDRTTKAIPSFSLSLEFTEEDSWRAVFTSADKDSTGTVHGSCLLEVLPL